MLKGYVTTHCHCRAVCRLSRCADPASTRVVKAEKNISYDRYKETVLDVFAPTAAVKGKRPGVIVTHGGDGPAEARKATGRISACPIWKRASWWPASSTGWPRRPRRAARGERRASRRAMVFPERQKVQRRHQAHRGDRQFRRRASVLDGWHDAAFGETGAAGESGGGGERLRHHRRGGSAFRTEHAQVRRHLGAGASRTPGTGSPGFAHDLRAHGPAADTHLATATRTRPCRTNTAHN